MLTKHHSNPQPNIRCPNKICGRSLTLAQYFPTPYFNGSKANCQYCGYAFDVWENALTSLSERSTLFRNSGAAFLGARQLTFNFELRPNEVVEIDLSNLGVPEQSKLLYVNATPTLGAGWPMEIHSNELLQRKRSNKLTFYGRPFPDNDGSAKDHDVCMMVTYIPLLGELAFLDHFALACEYFLDDQFDKMIVPCAVAIEQLIDRFTFELLSNQKLPTNLDISKRIALEVLIPLASGLLVIPKLEEKILDQIRKLWKLRNQMAHEGKIENSLSLSEAARLFTGCIFCAHYLDYFRAKIKLRNKFQSS